MEFSHHSSNPLEARPSDSTNQAYIRVLDETKRNQSSAPSSDELGQWSAKETYLTHINDITGQSAKRSFNDVTPKAGPSRVRNPVFIEDDMQSDDPLSRPFVEEGLMTSPRKQPTTPRKGEDTFNTPSRKKYVIVIPPYRKKVEAVEEVKVEEVSVEQELMDDDEIYVKEEQMEEQEEEEPDGHNEHGRYLNLEDDEEMAEEEDNRSGSRSSSPLTPCSSTRTSPYSSPQSSRPSSPDEALTMYRRPPEEQLEIELEFEQLYDSVPDLADYYTLVDRLGTGTFSSVYKAIDLSYNDFYNTSWLGHHPPESSAYYQSAGPGYKGRGGRAARWRHLNADMDVDATPDDDDEKAPEKVFVAIKRIYTTSGPERIRNELAIMEECRSCRHTSQIITAFRKEDQVVIVLPYQRNMDFREFYLDLHPEGIKCYFRCLFRALRDIHARGIIHRDVKPANFLYNPFTGVGTLCDFGLASRMEVSHPFGKCLHSSPSSSDPHGRTLQLDEYQTRDVKAAQREARMKSTMPSDRVGFPDKDTRPVSKANRAGTRGFRAPEVLLKCGAQNGAIDVWSAGVILLFFLTGKFPIFQSNDDIEGLMEIAVIIGKKKIERAATLHGRTIATNIPDLDQDGITWQEFVEKLNPGIKEPRKYDMRFYPHNSKHRDGRGSMMPPPPPPPSSSPTSLDGSDNALADPMLQDTVQQSERHANPSSSERHAKEMKIAFHFLESVLHFESTRRATPRKALYHKFLEEAGAPEDDAVVPHRIGEGVCEEYHFKTEDGINYARVFKKCMCKSKREALFGIPEDEVDLDADGDEEGECEELVEDYVELNAGEGVAIGKEPCEFHKGIDFTSGYRGEHGEVEVDVVDVDIESGA
ncbi:hypothetical protein CVT25_007409 [Psilocybe cyanescens]|uniref:non-specific serine/threonine protein kinase n=1 Tax=Psilocybe cyanescens TaxID=93625 RepID=A0A409XGB8_PSICY|nr:hypothetical protein CVT25_007409 [Psilocybe cyanescens]